MNDSEITVRIGDTRTDARNKTASMVIDIGDAAKNTKKSNDKNTEKNKTGSPVRDPYG